MDNVNRLILINQYRILDKLQENAHPDDSYAHAIKALQYNFEFDIEQLVSESAWDCGLNVSECRELMDIFEMYRRIKRSIDSLGPEDQKQINGLTWMTFTGFDGNNETNEHSYAIYQIKDQGKWRELLRGPHDDLNSHMPTLDSYRKMLNELRSIGGHGNLTADELRRIDTAA